MTSELFQGNSFILYLLFVLSVIVIDKFGERQKMAVIYLCTYGLTFQGEISCVQVCVLLTVMMFAIQEYFTLDKKKLSIFHKVHYKMADFLYMSIFQYKIWLVLIALILHSDIWMNCSWMTDTVRSALNVCSILTFLVALIWMFHVPEEFYSISHIYNEIWRFPYYGIQFNAELMWRLYIISEFEDDLIWERKKAYTIGSWEYVKVWYRRRYLLEDERNQDELSGKKKSKIKGMILFCKRMKKHAQGILTRGHSTIPMQLIRILSYKHGLVFNNSKNVSFKKYKIFKRKIYEWLYAHMFFEGLKDYLKLELCNDLYDYTAYLVYLYPHVVQCKIDGKTYAPAMKAFLDAERQLIPMEEWDIAQVYEMAYGFNGETITEKKIEEKKRRINERRNVEL